MSTNVSPSKATSSNRSGGSHNDSSDVEEGEEEDSSSSSLSQDHLSSFRDQWKQELKQGKLSTGNKKPKSSHAKEDIPEHKKQLLEDPNMTMSIEVKAKLLFRQGIEYEQSGKYYDAIICYKNAMQLVPDIEFKIYSESKQNRNKQSDVTEHKTDNFSHETEYDEGEDEEGDEQEEEDEYDGIEDLVSRFERLLYRKNTLFLAAHEQERTHISSLPIEVIVHILRFVMARHHDVRSLGMCSLVCRGFYLCSHDSGIWKAACMQMWGLECQEIIGSPYSSWRQMFLERPHVETIGCYISKTSYIRHGDNSFQDRTHRPWHVVVYYRYLRFFPGGQVLLTTTADPPSSVVGNLKWRTPKDASVLSGHYKLRDDRVFIVAKQPRFNHVNTIKGRHRRRKTNEYEPSDQTYNLELKIEHQRKKRNSQLTWLEYSVIVKNHQGLVTTTQFDTKGNKFPPFWFSRVKSYTTESDGTLEVNY